MSSIYFVTGGARSGKSRFAESLAARYSDVLYIATARAFDDEMKQRIAHHRASRPAHWQTVETCENLGDVLAGACQGAALLDCVTLLVTNLMMDSGVDWDHPTARQTEQVERDIQLQIDALIEGARRGGCDLIAVTNELGMGLVPVYAFGRVFRDIAGRVNQKLAAAADEAYLLVSGLPVRLK